MNKIKIVSLVLAVIMLLPMIASCGMETYTANNVSVIFRKPIMTTDEEGNETYEYDEEGNIKYEEVFKYDIPELTVTSEIVDQATGKTIKAPTVLTAVEVALKKYEKDFDLSSDKTYVASAFGLKESERLDADKGYFDYWQCKINDMESSEGRQSITRVYTNDVIVFTWTSGYKDRSDVTDEVTVDSNELVTGVIDDGQTEPVFEDEEE